MIEQCDIQKIQILVDELAHASTRPAALRALLECGPDALEDVCAGLGDGRWEVRRGCLLIAAQLGGPAICERLVPLLRDPKSRVRQTAVSAIASSNNAAAAGVPALLMERVLTDESLRVRRQALIHLAFNYADPQLVGFFRQLLDTETDPKLHKFAGIGWFLSNQRAQAATGGPGPC